MDTTIGKEIGIDLGTTTTIVSYTKKSGKLIQLKYGGEKLIPSVLYFLSESEWDIGEKALTGMAIHPLAGVANFKSHLSDPEYRYEVTAANGDHFFLKPREATKRFLKKIVNKMEDTLLKEFGAMGGTIDRAVITVPAKFPLIAKSSTKRAAKDCGLDVKLTTEPTAAATDYLQNYTEFDKPGTVIMVYDFGGGTFDAALVNAQDGILQVKDTEGDNYLGGKNLDFAIVDQIFIPYLKEHNSIDALAKKSMLILREGLKYHAEQAKNGLSFTDTYDVTSQLDEFGNDDDGNEIELDLTITQDELKAVLEPFFQKAIDICKNLISRNNLTPDQINSVILVGGPTQSPLLRQMLAEQITANVDTRIDPMTAVSLGAATYASTVDYNEEISEEENNVVALDISYEASTVETVEYVTIKVLHDESIGEVPENLSIELVRNDNAWSSGKINLSEDGEVVECYLQEDISNTFTVNAYDETGNSVNCFPRLVTILQGTKIVNAVLPYYIGIEVKKIFDEKDVFASLKGLEKNALLPAIGIINDLLTPNQITPGNVSEKLIVPIYQGEYNANGTSAVCNDHVFDVEITGEDITSPVPSSSPVDITIKIDRSQMMTFEATFGATGEIVEKPIEVSQRESARIKDVQKFLKDTKAKLNDLKSVANVTEEELSDPEKLLADIKNRFDAEKSSPDGRMHLLADIRRAYLAVERVENEHAWEMLEPKLDDIYQDAISANKSLGNEYDDEVNAMKEQYEELKISRDPVAGKRAIEEFTKLFMHITMYFQISGFISESYNNFDPYMWSDPKKAKSLLAKGYKLFSSGHASNNEIMSIMAELRSIIIRFSDNKPLQIF